MTKSRKKILLSSIAMLLVALVALGSATYAWFTINKVVTAESMKVTASVADGLVITNKVSHSTKDDWGAKAAFSSTATSLYAASMNVAAVGASGSTLTGGTTTMVYAKDVKKDGEYQASGYENGPTASNFADATLVSEDTTTGEGGLATNSNDYSSVYTFWIASSGEAMTGKTVTAKIEAEAVTSGEDGTTFIKAALCDDSGKVIGFWNDGGYTAIASQSSGVPTEASAEAATALTTGISAISNGTIPAYNGTGDNAPKKFTLYVWAEGNDPQCKNTASGYGANFKVTFTLAD